MGTNDLTLPLVIIRDGKVLDCCAKAAAKVRIGQKKRHAQQNCMEACFVEYDALDYQKAVQDFLDICAGATDVVEPEAGHSVFLDLGNCDPYRPLTHLAGAVIPALGDKLLVGLAPNKFLAKVAVLARLAGLTRKSIILAGAEIMQVREGEEASFLQELPVTLLWPLAKSDREKLNRLGFSTMGQVRLTPVSLLARQFGSLAQEIHRYCSGIDLTPVNKAYPPREITFSQSFDYELEKHQLWLFFEKQVLPYFIKCLTDRGQGYSSIALTVLFAHGALETKSSTLSSPGNPRALPEKLRFLFEKTSFKHHVTGVKVRVGGLAPLEYRQMVLFEGKKPLGRRAAGENQRLNRVLWLLRKKFQQNIVVAGNNLPVSRRERALLYWDPFRWRTQ